MNDHHQKKDGPQTKKKTTMKANKTKEPVEIDADGFILVTKENVARRIPPIQQQLQQRKMIMKMKIIMKMKMIMKMTRKKRQNDNDKQDQAWQEN
jgi:hypothetical protein